MNPVGTAARRELWLLIAVPTGVLGLLVAAMLSRPLGHPPSDYARMLALLAGVALLGSCQVIHLEEPRHRQALAARLWRVQLVVGGLWLSAELVLLAAAAGEASSGTLATVRASTVLSYARTLVGGRVSLLVIGCVLLAIVVLALARGASWSSSSVLALCVVALECRPLTGHSQISALAQIAVATHVLAAALWCGGLAGVALAAGGARGVWARLLPRFSVLAGWCAAVVAASGVLEAWLQLGRVAGLYESGYGRVVLGKTAVLLALLGLGWFARRRWVPEVSGHRGTAAVSLQRATVEVAVMGLALGLAVALATTG